MSALKKIFPSVNSQNALYLVGLTCSLLGYLQHETYWDFPESATMGMQYFSILLLSAHLFRSLGKYRKITEILALIFCFIITIIVGYRTQQFFLTYTIYILIFGAKGLHFKDIVKTYVIVGGLFWIITILGSINGMVKNVSDMRNINHEIMSLTNRRICFGYRWSTNMANHIFFVLLSYSYVVGGVLNKKEIIIYTGIILFVLYFSDCRLSAFCIFLIITFSILRKHAVLSIIGKTKIAKTAIVLCVPLMGILALWATISYQADSFNWFAINTFFSNRLELGQNMLEQKGVSVLGQSLLMYSSVRDDGEFYNYVDSSYLQLLLREGIVYTILFVSAFVFICYRAVKKKDTALLSTIFIAAFSGLIAQHFIEFYMNPLLLSLFSYHGSNPKKRIIRKVHSRSTLKKTIIRKRYYGRIT